jgi:phospholipase/carboxylesterase
MPAGGVRELLQGAVDAITGRLETEPHAPALVRVETDGELLWVHDPGIDLPRPRCTSCCLLSVWQAESLKEALLAVGEPPGLKLGKAQEPVNVAVTGRSVGLPLSESLRRTLCTVSFLPLPVDRQSYEGLIAGRRSCRFVKRCRGDRLHAQRYRGGAVAEAAMSVPGVPAHTRQGRLRLSPTSAGGSVPPAGQSLVESHGELVGLLYVPDSPPDRLVVMLHGAGGHAEGGLRLLRGVADGRRLLLFAPQSTGRTWDAIRPGYGPDVARIEEALTSILSSCPLERSDLVIGGFSDGASYALSLGLGNGDIFSAVLAFSPGFVAPGDRVGAPACFISHGRDDAVLPVDRCSRRIVPKLRQARCLVRCLVRYREFAGGHEVPADVVSEAMTWLSQLPPAGGRQQAG